MIPMNLGAIRDPYRPGTGPLVRSWIRPERRTLLTFRRYWPWFSLGVTCLLIVLATTPLQHDVSDFFVALSAAAFYVLMVVVLEIADRRAVTPTWQQHLGGIRKVGVLIGLTAVHWFLPAASTELWLLYLIPMLTLGVDLDRFWSIGLIAATMILMFLSAWPFANSAAMQADWPIYLRNGAIRAVMGGYAGATSYLLARSLAYQNNTHREALQRLFDSTVGDRWLNGANAVARIVADLFSSPNDTVMANVLVHDESRNTMKLAGSSNHDGRELAKDGFAFPADQGITSWAARHQQACFINDTKIDPEQRFLPNQAFPGTRSALAVPFRLDRNRSVVLEIESPVAHDVAYEDLQLMSQIASYLLTTYQRSEMLGFHQRLAELGKELADRIIRVEDIGAILEKIGEVALDLLDADIIGFYYRNPETSQIEQRRTIGELYLPTTGGSPANEPHSLVQQLMAKPGLHVFVDSQHDPLLTSRSAWHDQRRLDPFVLREGVQSCAAMPLVVGQEHLGLMWINYRRTQEFSPALRSSIEMLAPFAALAIRSSVQNALAERRRRDNLRRDLHDSLSARLRNAGFAMDRLEDLTPNTVRWKEELLTARLCVGWANTVVTTLKGERATPTLQSICTDLRTLAELSERIFGVTVSVTESNIPHVPVSHKGGFELLFACEEAIQNALRHSRASRIDVGFDYQPSLLEVSICDNGIGFMIDQLVRVNGIDNMRARVEHSLAGTFELESSPGKGVTITFCIPIPDMKETSHDPSERTSACVIDRE